MDNFTNLRPAKNNIVCLKNLENLQKVFCALSRKFPRTSCQVFAVICGSFRVNFCKIRIMKIKIRNRRNSLMSMNLTVKEKSTSISNFSLFTCRLFLILVVALFQLVLSIYLFSISNLNEDKTSSDDVGQVLVHMD